MREAIFAVEATVMLRALAVAAFKVEMLAVTMFVSAMLLFE